MPRCAEAAPTAEQSCSGWRGIFAALRNLLHLFFHKRSTNAEDLNPKSSCTHHIRDVLIKVTCFWKSYNPIPNIFFNEVKTKNN